MEGIWGWDCQSQDLRDYWTFGIGSEAMTQGNHKGCPYEVPGVSRRHCD